LLPVLFVSKPLIVTLASYGTQTVNTALSPAGGSPGSSMPVGAASGLKAGAVPGIPDGLSGIGGVSGLSGTGGESAGEVVEDVPDIDDEPAGGAEAVPLGAIEPLLLGAIEPLLLGASVGIDGLASTGTPEYVTPAPQPQLLYTGVVQVANDVQQQDTGVQHGSQQQVLQQPQPQPAR
jgi:hypothetical protein